MHKFLLASKFHSVQNERVSHLNDDYDTLECMSYGNSQNFTLAIIDKHKSLKLAFTSKVFLPEVQNIIGVSIVRIVM